MDDVADVAVEDLLLVVVPDLHDLVADPELAAPRAQPLPAGSGSSGSSALRLSTPARPLYMGLMTWICGDRGRNAEPARDARPAQVDDGLERLRSSSCADEVEVRFLVVPVGG